MYKGIIFDLDGLLIDSEIVSYHLYKEFVGNYGHTLSLDDYTSYYSGKSGKDNIISLIHDYHLPINIEEGLKYKENQDKINIEKGIPLKQGALELLMYLKKRNMKIALATSSAKERALPLIHNHHIDIYFDDFVFGTDVKRGKPNPDIFIKACVKLGLDTKECLVLEDSEAGIEAAYQAGIDVVCIPDIKEPDQNFKDKTVKLLDSLSDVILYLKLHHEYKIIAFDMDGTLLNSQKVISENTIKSINEAMKKGMIIIFNTGRCPSELAEYFDYLDIRYLNCISGALVYDRKNECAIFSKSIPHDIVEKLILTANKEDTMIQILNKDSIVERRKLDTIEKYHMEVYKDMYERVTVKVKDMYEDYMANPFTVEKLNIYHTDSEARERTKQRILELGLDVEMANAEETSLELSPQNVNKAIGLEKLCEHLGITIHDVIAVGDADNDKDALKASGLAVAMGNAKEYIKNICDIIVSDNDHDGCVEVINKFVK